MSVLKGVHIPVKRREKRSLVPGVEEVEGEQTQVVDTVSQDTATSEAKVAPSPQASTTDWKDMAIRLRAEMENYRKRQARLAEARITREKDALLIKFLKALDNLDKVLPDLNPDSPVHHGVKVTYDAILALLQSEGVQAIPAVGEIFDPNWHEAVAVIPAQEGREMSPPDGPIVVDQEQRGYRIGDRLLRPARVVVMKHS